jgi:hypothetical protein
MRKLLLAAALLPFTYICTAQQTGRMETDRPDQTESPVITKKNYIQSEWGFNIEKENKLKTFVHPTILWKYGASKRFEFRLITESVTQETPLIIPAGNDYISGMLPIQLGGKLSLWSEKGVLPQTSFLFHVAPSKFGSKKFHTDKWAPNFRFTMNNTLSDVVGVGYNLGAEWDGFSNTPAWVYTFAPGFNIGKNWYGYAEVFGAIKKNESPEHSLDGGLAYYFSDNSKIDISSGVGISEAATDWYGAIGYSFRFSTKKKK